MSGGTYQPKQGANAAGVVDFYVVFTTSAANSGADDITVTSSMGYKVTSITGPTTTGTTGKFLITLNESCQKLMECTATVDEVVGAPIYDRCVACPVDEAASPLAVAVFFADKAGTAKNAASRVIRVKLSLRLSTVGN